MRAMPLRSTCIVLFAVLIPSRALGAASTDSGSLRAVAGHSFYAEERQEGQLILLGDEALLGRTDLLASVFLGQAALARQRPIERGRRITVPFDLSLLPNGDSEVTCVLTSGAAETWSAKARVTKLPPKRNAVQIDRVSGGLVVDGLSLFPFGFYCYSPVQPTLAEEEVVRGFNMMSPYQQNDADGLEERRRYMDRCAELGMKVHYHIVQVAGLGGVNVGDAPDPDRREELLRTEVEAFRDHTALLAWYICDEPTGHNATPEQLARTYQIVRELDPYHPISIVFMAPERAREYGSCMDVVMTDPYPIPHGPPASVRYAVAHLADEFDGEKPIWMVPQAFGGNEHWTREPTAREQRVMTYLGLIHGATGIQYFIRHGLGGFPKSTVMWGECGRLALEVAELTPALLSHEARPVVSSPIETVEASAWRDRGMIVALAVNTENRPRAIRLDLVGIGFSGQAEVLFEDRRIEVADGAIEDVIDGFGTRAYQIPVGPLPGNDLSVHPRSRIVNPSFESNPSPGTPAGCYADVGAGRGATYLVDSRVARHGRHSVRLVAPTGDQGVTLSPYAPYVTPATTYRLSVWAKAADCPRAPNEREEMPSLRLSASGLGEQSFPLTTDWQEYAIEGKTEEGAGRCWIGVSLVSPGTAWIDLLQFRDISPIIRAGPGIFVGETQVVLETPELGVELRYTLDGSDPTPGSSLYAGPIALTDTAMVKAASFRQGVMVGNVVEAALTRVEYLDPAEVEGLRPGIEYAYYEGTWTELPDFDALSAVERGLAGQFGVLDLARGDDFAFRFTGYISLPEDGIYRFSTRSDDGSKLLIGDREVVSNDGLHGRAEQSGSVALRAGPHPITVTFFEHVGAAALEVYYEGPNIPRQPIPASVLRHRED